MPRAHLFPIDYPTGYAAQVHRYFSLAKAVTVFDSMDCVVKKAEFLEDEGRMVFEVSWANTKDICTVVIELVSEYSVFWVSAWQQGDDGERWEENNGSSLAAVIGHIVTIWDRG